MIRPTVAALSTCTLLLASACSGPTGLLASGSISVDAGTHTTGFPLGNEMRLEDPSASADLGRLSGTCELRELSGAGPTQYSVAVTIQRGMIDDNGLASFTILHRTDLPAEQASVALSLGTTAYTGREDGTCTVEVTHAIAGGGMVGFDGSCTVADAAGDTAEVAIDLTMSGCDVVPAGG